VATNLLNYIRRRNQCQRQRTLVQANYYSRRPASDTNGFDLRVDRTIIPSNHCLCAGAGNAERAIVTDSYLSTLNSFLPPDHDTEHNNNLIVSTTT